MHAHSLEMQYRISKNWKVVTSNWHLASDPIVTVYNMFFDLLLISDIAFKYQTKKFSEWSRAADTTL